MTIVFDLDGVVYLGEVMVPGARDVLEWCRGKGWQTLFATNNSVRTPDEVIAKIQRVTGFEADQGDVITSAMAAAALVAERRGSQCLVVGERGIVEALRACGIRRTEDPTLADHVVVGLTRDVTYDALARAATATRNGATLIASNLDATFPTPDGLRPGAGSIVAAVETAAGQTAIPAGKPFAPMRRLVEERANGPVVVVGDRPDTDIALGRIAGWPTVLCLSGVVRDRTEIPVEHTPDYVIASVADLPDALAAALG